MGSTFDITQATQVLKVKYSPKKVKANAYEDQPFFAMVPKDTKAGGLNYTQAINIGTSQTRNVSFGGAVASSANAGGASRYKQFVCQYFEDFATANFSGRALDAAKGDANAFVDVLTSETDNALLSLSRSIGISLYRNGGGARGQILSGQGTPTIVLVNPQDITNFEVDMPVRTSATDGTSGAVKAGVAFVVGVDRDLGAITVSATLGGAAANWTTPIATAAASDFIFADGDFGAVTPGLAGWVPPTAPTATLFNGVDRTADVTRLGGIRYNGNGGPFEETLIEAAARAGRESAKPDACFMNPLNFSTLVKALSGKVMYERMGNSSDEPTIGFSGVKLVGPKGPISVYSDVNCPIGTAFMLTMSTWTLVSMGDAPKWLDVDGQRILRVSGADAYEARLGSRHALICSAPGKNVNITL